MNAILKGVRVLVTRPQHQAGHLSQLIAARGGIPVLLPTIAIAPIDDAAAIAAGFVTSNKYKWLIFISANAVNFAAQAIGGKIKAFSESVAAIGQSTAKALAEVGLNVDLVAPPPHNSEALLATTAMQQVAGQRILIIRGEGGRDELANILGSRGAQVDYLNVYRRIVPATDCAPVDALLAKNGLDVITVTSGEALNNLFVMIDENHHQRLLQIPLVVISERVKQLAAAKGFSHIAVANNPSDEAIIEMVIIIKGEIG